MRGASKSEEFEELFLAHYPTMVRLAALLGADDPEDIAQEAFLRLEQRLDKLGPSVNAGAYVRTTVVNLSRSRLRHLRVVRRFNPEVPLVESAEMLAVLSDEKRRVIKALSTLSERRRQVVVLRYWLDLSEAEIADTLGIAPGTVKSTSSAALAALADVLGEAHE